MKVSVSYVPVGTAFGRLAGEGEVAGIALAELGRQHDVERVPSTSAWTLDVVTEPPPTGDPFFGGVQIVGDGFVVRLDRMDLDLHVRFVDERPEATLHVGRRGPHHRIPRRAYPWLERTAMRWEEAQAYHVALVTEALSLMSPDAAVLHCSAVEREGRALLLVSAGGVGKTTTACRLVARHGFRHLADDIATVSRDGTVPASRRKLMVYPYNAADLPVLSAAAAQTGVKRADALWRLQAALGVDRRRRRLAAPELFGSAGVGERSATTSVVLLRRTHRRGVHVEPTTPQRIAEAANEIVALEFSRFLDPLRTCRALIGGPANCADEVLRVNRMVLENAFSGARLALMDIGPHEDPGTVLAEIHG